jgi:glycosyltransferase involved in cell wall biosynthesis
MKSKDNPLVTIIMCFLNEEKFISEAVESILAQDYPHWELFLIDDGSSDGSVEIAKRFESEYANKIFYFDHPGHVNKGLSASRNLGIKSANGEYIALIDADDVWLSGKLTKQLKLFKQHKNITVVVEGSKYWSSWMDPVKADIVIPVGACPGVYEPPHLAAALYPLGKGSAPCPSGIVAERSVFNRCPFEESFRGIYQMYEDQAFLCKVYLNETVYVSSGCNNLYRQRPESLVSSVHQTGKYHIVRSHYLRWFRDYLGHQPLEYKNIQALLDRAQLQYDKPVWHKITVDFPRYAREAFSRFLVRLGVVKYRKIW